MLLILPVVLLAGAGNPPCPSTGTPNASTPPGGPASGGMYAQPLKLQQGKWYEVGATDYGGPDDPTGYVDRRQRGLSAGAPRHVRRALRTRLKPLGRTSRSPTGTRSTTSPT